MTYPNWEQIDAEDKARREAIKSHYEREIAQLKDEISELKANSVSAQVFLSRRNLLTLLSKLDRKANGEQTECTIIKKDTKHKTYPQTHNIIFVTALEDAEYYTDRLPGGMHPADDPDRKLSH